MPWWLTAEAYMRLSHRKSVGELFEFEQPFWWPSSVAVMSGGISGQTIFHRLNAGESRRMPVNNEVDLVWHNPELRSFVGSPANMYYSAVGR
jgi:hypothetical protein